MKMIRFAGIYAVSLGLSLSASAAPVSENQASNAAQSFIVSQAPALRAIQAGNIITNVPSFRTVRLVEPVYQDREAVAYVAHLSPSGYVLMGIDDQVPPVKLHSDNGAFSNLPPTFVKLVLLEIRQDLDAVHSGAHYRSFATRWAGLSKPPSSPTTQTAVGVVGVPLLQTKWNQTSPYNLYYPSAVTTPSYNGRAVAGCVTVAFAQVLKYHNWPESVSGNHTCYDTSGNCQGSFSLSDVGLYSYDWANMPNSVNDGSSLAAKQAIGRLMYHCAVALDSDFGGNVYDNGTSAYGNKMASALSTYFSYDSGGLEYRSDYSDEYYWFDRIRNDINANRPILYAMRAVEENVGHVVVCDGYRGDGWFTSYEIDLNFGWGGIGNAWYNLDSVVDPSHYYTWVSHQAVFGISPREPPSVSYITVSGATQVNESSGAQYTCMAYYSDGSSENISSSVSWSENSSYASINSSGYLTTYAVSADQSCQITASYGWYSDTHDITIKNIATPILSVSPNNQSVGASAGTTTFTVSNTGGGTMSYSTSEAVSWLSITGGGSGGNSGTITVSYDANPNTSPRTGTITVTAPGATGSPVSVTITQAGSTSSAKLSVLLQAGDGGMAGIWTLGSDCKPATWKAVTGPMGSGWVLRALDKNRILLQQGNGGIIGIWDLDVNGIPSKWWTVSGPLPGWIARDLDGNRVLLQAGDGGMIGLWTLDAKNTPATWKGISAPIANLVARNLCGNRLLLQFSGGLPIGYWTLDSSNTVTAWIPNYGSLPAGWTLRSMTKDYMLLQAGDGGMAGAWTLGADGQPTAWYTITAPMPGWILRGIDQQ